MNNKLGSDQCCSGYPNCKCIVDKADYSQGKEYCLSCVGNANEMARLQKVVEEQKGERESLIKHEKALSDAYLRIRSLVGAWDTNHGGENRFEVTENKVKDLQSQLAEQTERVRIMTEALQRIRDHYDQDGYGEDAWKKLALEMAEVAGQALKQESLGEGK